MTLKASNKKCAVSLSKSLSPEQAFFLEPQDPKQRQYEALRAYFAENLSGKEAAVRFGYSLGAFHVLCHKFRNDPDKKFFLQTRPGPKYGPKKDQTKERVLALRKRNYSIPDIQRLLLAEGLQLSPVSIWAILKAAGFSRLPRRKDEDRPQWPKPEQAAYADVRQLSFERRAFETKLGGAFLLVRILADMGLHEIPKSLGWYGSKMIPTENAFLSCLLLKLIQKPRKCHVMDLNFDQGCALATGLNELPKTAYLSEYSERLTHQDQLRFLQRWLTQLRRSQVLRGESFNLDFQSLPYYGEEEVVEKHYVSMRSRRQKAVLVFFAQDAESKLFCYSNADLRKGEENDECAKRN